MRISLIVVAAASLVTVGAQAEEPGWYVGGIVGLNSAQSTDSQASLPVALRPSTTAATSPQPQFAPSLSLVLGRDWRLSERFSAGWEAEASYLTARGDWGVETRGVQSGRFGSESTDATATAVWTLPFQAALRARASVALTPGLSLYAGAGPAVGFARLRSSVVENGESAFIPNNVTRSTNFADFSGAGWTPGVNVAAGLAAELAHGFEFRAEYAVSAFRPVSLSIAAPGSPFLPGGLKTTPLVQGLRIGAVRRF